MQGIKLFIAYPEDKVYGNISDSRYISSNVFDKLGVKLQDLIDHIDEVIDIEINPKGKIVGIEL